MIPKIIEYKIEGNVLYPLVYMDLSLLIDDYDSIMLNVKQRVRRKRRA
ncbi:hypothetical protein [Paenibacillus ehimensis]|uniref:Uncharacterized protein n=1 Tax=Paenibacillus ehimensis TaxID=79264 RepID=A0ABT8VB74_9BACL|nr:hypothetical protein [Paenibacillus ehimensis]MDO3678251.1 hypothetical protein [Paenibacillus ehimensis]MEC0210292.1 hypothetical protein [Paenibacillus ehimensis]